MRQNLMVCAFEQFDSATGSSSNTDSRLRDREFTRLRYDPLATVCFGVIGRIALGVCLGLMFDGNFANAQADYLSSGSNSAGSDDRGRQVLVSDLPVEGQEGKERAHEELLLEQSWRQTGWPFLERYCLECHNKDSREGELELESFEALGGVRSESSTLQRVLEMVQFSAMPPEDSDQPEESLRKRFASVADQILYAVTCDLRPRPGKVTARRLNRAEYNNSVRDLFDIHYQPAKDFPSDEVGAGFDNNGDVLSLSTLLMEKYLDAAEAISAQVIIDPESLPKLKRDFPSDEILISGDTRVGRFNGRFFGEDGFAWIDLEVPYVGEYQFSLYGGGTAKDSHSEIGVLNQDGVLLASGKLGYFGGGGSSDRFRFVLKLDQSVSRLVFVPMAKIVEQEGSDRPQFAIDTKLTQAVIEKAKQVISRPLKPDSGIDAQDFPHMIRRISVDGPKVFPRDAYPKSHHHLIRRVAVNRNGEWERVEEAASECLKPIMKHAFRREISAKELERYVSLVRKCTDRGMSYFEGMQTAIAAVLVSPSFLFRVEVPPTDTPMSPDSPIPLTAGQLVTRLSYFLWSSLPDEELLSLGEQGQLTEVELLHQVERMIKDGRSSALAEQFAAQWFGLRNLETHEADLEIYPGFTTSLRAAMGEETKRLFMHVLHHNRPITELLSADYSFLNPELAEHYGLEPLEGSGFRRVSLEGSGRRGLLTHASFLTLTSYPRRTSPVQRGKWILENIFGTPPPDPPVGVPTLEDSEQANASLSLREQMEIHRRDPACSSCHRVMDQLGFGLQEFNAIGSRNTLKVGNAGMRNWRGELPGGRKFSGAVELSEVLSRSEAKAFAGTAVERLLTFALGRELRPQDRCVVEEIVKKTEAEGYRLRDLVGEVVVSLPFRFYEWEAETVSRDRSGS